MLDIELPVWFKEAEVSASEFLLSDDSGVLFTSTARGMDWV
ncbi:hypothetical protein ACODG4_01800 [Vagococcus fluvialis]